MTFKIYGVETGGTALLTVGPQTVTCNTGIYNVQLGPVDNTVFDGSDKWLEVIVGSDVMIPRLKINAVAYAINSLALGGEVPRRPGFRRWRQIRWR